MGCQRSGELEDCSQGVNTLIVRREEIPNFQDVSAAQKALTEGDQWKTFWFYEERDVLRYYLGLIIPGPEGSCRIRIGNDVRGWKEGKSMIFDDSNEHEVWNDNDSDRVVLFVEFVCPTIFPLSLVDRTLICALGRYPL